jgi:transketolase
LGRYNKIAYFKTLYAILIANGLEVASLLTAGEILEAGHGLKVNTASVISEGLFTKHISKRLDFINPNFRMKKCVFRFIMVATKWIQKG